ncbi:S-adenosyl-L-methionine-dependent methyltransferase [Cokeromyces recurvatus]|uniref:S-adenosyl-L-methionine-dependent methyltransferase n=1 Tax=Cokeromyces recurvatus TaxID=90255 RepID=UPI0022205E3D|nr:S-adenosyl-L-methionine-dependent methyltransferase [Cokeromyces recurvatus]KAI7904036.1 S-adenosyl-L-methionine-dependent methyltransferase [Cokeromyces recurvatus]
MANKVTYSGSTYSKFRPSYSDEIYSLIYKFHEEHNNEYDTVIDVGTGTGQVAVELSKKFKQVYGIDALSEQIKNATPRENITYQVGPAEDLSQFENSSVDMITVGTAFHWFDHSQFFKEAKRVLKRETGTLAIFGYFYPVIKDEPKANELIKALHTGPFDKYSNQNIRFIRNMYRDIVFPFTEQVWYITPKTEDTTNISHAIQGSLMKASMSLEHFRHYMKTSSAYFNYIKENPDKEDPIDKLMNDILSTTDIKDLEQVVKLEWPTVLVLAKND